MQIPGYATEMKALRGSCLGRCGVLQKIEWVAPSMIGQWNDKYQACNSRVLHLSNSAEILPEVASGKKQEAASVNTFFSQLSNVSDCYANRP